MARYEFDDRIYLAGEWVKGAGKPADVIAPYTEETILTIGSADAGQVDEAMQAAKAAQKEWAALPPGARAAKMNAFAQVLDARKDEIADWISREIGGTRVKSGLEVMLATNVFRSSASLPYMVEGQIMPEDIPGKESRVYREPVGVVALISPWNFPLQLTSRTLGPALAVGNAVVIKPATDSAVTGGLIFAKIADEVGFPKGLISVLPGPGGEVGTALVKHPIPRVVSFTGSTPVGREIGKAAMDSPIIKHLELELGGNSPIVVLDDADIDYAVEASVWGKFMHVGQICMIANRIIVDASVYDEFVEKFVARTKALKVGDPSDPEVFIGPMINRSQFEGALELIEKAKAEGATLALGGEAKGLVLPPHVFTGVAPDSCLLTQEIFGPIVAIQKVADEAEALEMANNTDYGLSSSVFTRDEGRGLRFARQVEAGMTHINDQPVNDSAFSPFGGAKNSGIGRFNGKWAVSAFTTDHWITVQHEKREFQFKA